MPVHHQLEPGRWLQPRTLGSAALIFAVAYVVWQSIGQVLLMHLLIGRPLPFTTLPLWRDFLLVCAALGAVAGPIWLSAQRLSPNSWRRAWLQASATMLPMVLMLLANEFTERGVIAWVGPSILAAMATGVLWMPVWRWSARSEHRGAIAAEPGVAADGGPGL